MTTFTHIIFCTISCRSGGKKKFERTNLAQRYIAAHDNNVYAHVMYTVISYPIQYLMYNASRRQSIPRVKNIIIKVYGIYVRVLYTCTHGYIPSNLVYLGSGTRGIYLIRYDCLSSAIARKNSHSSTRARRDRA